MAKEDKTVTKISSKMPCMCMGCASYYIYNDMVTFENSIVATITLMDQSFSLFESLRQVQKETIHWEHNNV